MAVSEELLMFSEAHIYYSTMVLTFTVLDSDDGTIPFHCRVALDMVNVAREYEDAKESRFAKAIAKKGFGMARDVEELRERYKGAVFRARVVWLGLALENTSIPVGYIDEYLELLGFFDYDGNIVMPMPVKVV